MKITHSEDKENGLLAVFWGDTESEDCEEFKDEYGNEFVLDHDKQGRIIGIEILTWEAKK